jgi:hypothetical protein
MNGRPDDGEEERAEVDAVEFRRKLAFPEALSGRFRFRGCLHHNASRLELTFGA